MDKEMVRNPIEVMRERIAAWLGRGGGETEQLVRWLQGYDLPPVGHDEEPYLWLLRGLPLGDRHEAETQFARRVREFLADRPDVSRPGRRPDQVLYNVLMLCAGLGRPEQLGEPLYEMFRRPDLKGEWLGVNLRTCLRDALIENQIDRRLEPVWKAMLAGKPNELLPGSPYDGFAGIGIMPSSRDEPHQPALDGIGSALKTMAFQLKPSEDSRRRLHSLLNRLRKTWADQRNWDEELVRLADWHQWPWWAVQCLPLFIPTREPAGPDCRVCLSAAIVYEIVCRQSGCQVETEFCNGLIVKVRINQRLALASERIAREFEEDILANPFSSFQASKGVILHSIVRMALELKEEDPELARMLEEAHRRNLQTLFGIHLPDPPETQFVRIQNSRLRARSPIAVGISRHNGSVEVCWADVTEFGYGSNTSEAMDDLGKTLLELYSVLEERAGSLSIDLMGVHRKLREHLELLPA